jgi:hypothetical protein
MESSLTDEYGGVMPRRFVPGAKNGALMRGIAILCAEQGDVTPGHLVAAGLTRRQADNAIGYALRRPSPLIRRVSYGVYRRLSHQAA